MALDTLTDARPKTADDDVSALSRGLSLLETITASPHPLTVKELAQQTGIPRPTVARIASTLVNAGYVRQLEGKDRFFPTTRSLELANTFLAHFDMRKAVRPFLRELAEECGAAVHLCLRNRLDMVVIESVRPSVGPIIVRLGLGDRLQLAHSAIGRAHLASLPPEERDPLVESLRLSGANEGMDLRAMVKKAARELGDKGFVSAFGDWHSDINAVAVPLQSPAGEHFAINCGGPAFLFSRETVLEHLGPRLVDTVAKIQELIGRVVLGA
ncbi:IclR family transcriptional regulator [Paraburkholderia caballeronis]|uniref:IclR family transcriptional regulator n=1 Tax=Paraburkholderia caballeronis TaxID=416943 RepID=UPI001066B81E|nr:IclR family transcriptional regulator [Paraburkholderia caballeronis]TDV19597.1 IclR family transcriptional regulator [Paraburkholderia caballeronis]TDV22197.1 IclR family transcriptional regulator [Paraburkholderia caballeronis]TDV29101.1 IclR family transcriptional regulator [Paraburkholderia caballeronis]